MSIALVFPGQGSQAVGMLDGVPSLPALRPLLDSAEALSGLKLRRMAAEGPIEHISDTRAAQPLLYLADWAWGTAAIEAGVAPAALAGHSLGEFAALAVAGVFPVQVGLELVIERSRLMANSASDASGGMAAILGLDSGTIADAISGIDGVWMANDNTPGQIVISGTPEGLSAASAALSSAGARRVVPLQVSGAFHSPLMEDAARRFSDLLERTDFADATLPVYQNADPSPSRDGAVIRFKLAQQMTSAVRWTETMFALRDDGIEVLLECGPGGVLAGLVKRIEGLTALTVETGGIGVLTGEGEVS